MKSLRSLTLLLLIALQATVARAQTVQQQPTVVESHELDMTSSDTETTSVFSGNVIVTGTNLKLTCDRLEVIALRQKESKGAVGKVEGFKSMIAIGNVRLIQGGREAACGRAIVLPGDDKLILQEKPVLVDREANWTYQGDEVVLHRGQRQVTGKNIKLVGPALKDLGVDKGTLLESGKAAMESSKTP